MNYLNLRKIDSPLQVVQQIQHAANSTEQDLGRRSSSEESFQTILQRIIAEKRTESTAKQQFNPTRKTAA